MRLKLLFIMACLAVMQAFAAGPADISGQYYGKTVDNYLNRVHNLTITAGENAGEYLITGFWDYDVANQTPVRGTYDQSTGELTIPYNQVFYTHATYGETHLMVFDHNKADTKGCCDYDIVFVFEPGGYAKLKKGESLVGEVTAGHLKVSTVCYELCPKSNGRIVTTSDADADAGDFQSYTYLNGNNGFVIGFNHRSTGSSWQAFTLSSNTVAFKIDTYMVTLSGYGLGGMYASNSNGSGNTGAGAPGTIDKDAGTMAVGPYQYLVKKADNSDFAGRWSSSFIYSNISFPAINVATTDDQRGWATKTYNGSYVTLKASKGGFQGWYDDNGNCVSTETTLNLNFISENAGTYTARYNFNIPTVLDSDNPCTDIFGTYLSAAVDNNHYNVSNKVTITAGETEGAVKISGLMGSNQQIDGIYDPTNGHLTIPAGQIVDSNGNCLGQLADSNVANETGDIVIVFDAYGHGTLSEGANNYGLCKYNGGTVNSYVYPGLQLYRANGKIKNNLVKEQNYDIADNGTTEFETALILNDDQKSGILCGIEGYGWLDFTFDNNNNVVFDRDAMSNNGSSSTIYEFYKEPYTYQVNVGIIIPKYEDRTGYKPGRNGNNAMGGTINTLNGQIVTGMWGAVNSSGGLIGFAKGKSVITFPGIDVVSSEPSLGSVSKTYHGPYLTLQATTLNGGEFLGWYDNQGNLLSTDATMNLPFWSEYVGIIVGQFTTNSVNVQECDNPAASALGTFITGDVDLHGCNTSYALTITAGATAGVVKISGINGGNQQINGIYDATTGHLTIPGGQIVDIDDDGNETRLALMNNPSLDIVFNIELGGHGYLASGLGLTCYTDTRIIRTDSKDWNFYMANGTITNYLVDRDGNNDIVPQGTTNFTTAFVLNADQKSGAVYGIEGYTWQAFTIDDNDNVVFTQTDVYYYNDSYTNVRFVNGFQWNLGSRGITGAIDKEGGTITTDPWTGILHQKSDGTGFGFNGNKDRSIITFPAIKVVSNDANLGTVSKAYKGLYVTISATPIGDAPFMGWYDSEGNLISTDATTNIPFWVEYAGTYTACFAYEETLPAVAESGVENSFYALNDIACAYLTSDYREGYVSLICKDDNGYANKDVKGDDAVDYILSLSGLETRTSQDQSNWIVLNLPEDKVTSTSDLYDLAGKTIVGAQGKFMRDGSNMEIELLQQPTAGDEQTIEYNNYIPANFAGTQTCEGNGLTYFFVTPKPMEVATIHWAYYDGTQFTTIPKMTANGTIFNAAGLEGSVSVNMSMFPDVELIPETSYSFTAIIINNGAASQAPGRRAAAGNAYTVIPVTVPTPDGIEGGVVTGVNDLRNATVQSKNYASSG